MAEQAVLHENENDYNALDMDVIHISDVGVDTTGFEVDLSDLSACWAAAQHRHHRAGRWRLQPLQETGEGTGETDTTGWTGL